MPKDAQLVLQNAVVQYEKDSYKRFQELTRILDTRMVSGGMQILRLDEAGEKKYRELANDVIWERLEERSPNYYTELRSKFYRSGESLN